MKIGSTGVADVGSCLHELASVVCDCRSFRRLCAFVSTTHAVRGISLSDSLIMHLQQCLVLVCLRAAQPAVACLSVD